MNVSRRFSRRALLAQLLAGSAALAAYDLAEPFIFGGPLATAGEAVSPDTLRLGATFSPIEAQYMHLDPKAVLADLLKLKLDFIRVGAYWNELEQRDGYFEWDRLDWILEAAGQAAVPVILTIGIKAPVWPEFHIPWWVHERVWLPPTGLITRDPRLVELGHRYTRMVAERYSAAPEITVLQVENEPFEPVLTEHGWSLDDSFLREQVRIVRSADTLGRPILLTAYVGSNRVVTGLQGMLRRFTGNLLLNPVFGNRPDSTLIDLADQIGLDIYPGIGMEVLGQPMYFRADTAADFGPLLAYRKAVVDAGKQVMIAECQAKPWEPGDKVYRLTDTPSFRPPDMARLVSRLAGYGFGTITLWGVEHWYWHRENGDRDWWDSGERLLANRALLLA